MKEISPSIIKRIIDSSSIEDLRENLKIENEQDIFKILLEYLDLIVDKYDNGYKEASYKIINFLEKLSASEITNIISKCSMLIEEKYKIIEILKNDDTNLKDKEIITLKELANKLENLEVSISLNLNSLSLIENYNIVKHILFKEKNKNLSTFIINNNSYLIEAFNKNNENILVILTDNYLNAIDSFVKEENFYDLFYYDELLEEILKNDKISKNEKIIDTCIRMIRNHDISDGKTSKQINKAAHWYKHLERRLDNKSYEEDENQLNDLYGISPYFKKPIEEEGYTLGKSKKELEGFNKTKDYIFTIDNNLAYDMDDAISITKEDGLYKLKIYVADPNSFCSKDSSLMNEARRRVETIYTDKVSVGIFPRDIIAYYLSLEQNSNRYARVYEYTISESGIITGFEIRKEIVNVSHNYSYEEFNSALENPKNEEEETSIKYLLELNNIINKKYIGKINNSDINAESILENYILFTNTKVAEFFALRGVPFIYKFHSNTDKRINNVLDLEINKKYKNIVKGAIKEGTDKEYSLDKTSHEGLNLKYYCHSTSPLHTYADILLNECEDVFYFKNPSDKEADNFEKYLKEEIEYINEKTVMLDRYRKKYEKAKVRARK